LDLAASILQYWQSQIGQTRNEIQEGLTPVLYRSRNLLIARGLNKLVEDQCELSDVCSQQELRAQAFAQSATRIRNGSHDVREHHKTVAADLSMPAQDLYNQLYGDLPQFAVLSSAWNVSGQKLIHGYNMAQAQGLCVYARRMQVRIVETDTGFRRQLLKALRFRRLLADIQQDDAGNLILDVSGPASVLEQHQRYGLNLALFLPAIACASEWSVKLTLRAPKKECKQDLSCVLSHEDQLHGDSHFLAYIPTELKKLLAQLESKVPQWRFDDQAPLLVMDKGEVVVPDLRVRCAEDEEKSAAIEFFHRWHSRPLKHRLRQLADGQAPNLIIAVDKQIFKSKEYADLENDPIFQQRGFVFRDFPTVTALKKAVQLQFAI
ncbi:MAG: DUF790 family protein, partial [Planctomycetes bacterium]|nr:DUF790 family protein [Planctomycetota bacterium]